MGYRYKKTTQFDRPTKTINPLGSPQGRHFDNGRTILPQGSPQGRHLQSPLGKGSLRKSPF